MEHWNKNGTEILKITGNVPKVSKKRLEKIGGIDELHKTEIPRGYYRR